MCFAPSWLRSFRSFASALILIGTGSLAPGQDAPSPAPTPRPEATAPAGLPASTPPADTPAATLPKPPFIIENADGSITGLELPRAEYIHADFPYAEVPKPAPAAMKPAAARPVARAAGPDIRSTTGESSRPFTGFLRIRQQDGTVTYDINIHRGKVVAGIETHKGADRITSDIVGGWFDRDRLVLMVQARDADIANKWQAHLHQFRRTDEGFVIEHSLLGFGQTDANSPVYRPHTIDRMVEVD